MRFLAFSDIHAHVFPYGATYVPYGIFKGLHNSRLIDTMKALEQISDYAINNNIDTILFGGDLYHTRQSIKTVARNITTHVIKTKFLDRGLNLIMIPGNHDYADRSGNIHSLQPLKYLSNNIHVLDSVQARNIGEHLSVFSVPYTDDVKQARVDLQVAASLARSVIGRVKVLLCHLGIQGAVVGSDFVMMCPSDVENDEIPFDAFDVCLFGHYHQHQLIAKNAWYIGALTQQNWSDVNGLRGFVDITYAGGKVILKHIETDAPKFTVCTSESDLQAVRKEDFVKYITEHSLTEDQQLQLRQLCKSPNLEIKPVKQLIKTPELQFDAAQLNAETALKPWVEANAGELDPEELLLLGRELLSLGQEDEIS